MKTKSVLFKALAVSQFFGLAALAQSANSTTTTAVPVSNGPGAAAAPAVTAPTSDSTAAPAGAIAGTSTTTVKAKPPINVNYLGIMNGPGLSNELDGKTYNKKVPYLESRPSISYNFTNDVDVGLQARFNVRMGSKVDVVNGSYRLYNNVRNIYKDDVLQFNLLTRAVLPTSNANHDQSMTISPELLPILNITPKNSRFSLSVYPQLLRFLYTNTARASAAGATKMVALANFEGTYQLTGETQITFGFYPEWVTEYGRATYNDSNELDLGVSFNIAKGWSLNPFVAAEFVGMGANNDAASKKMAINMVISGALL